MNYKELLNHLLDIKEDEFASFSKSLSSSEYISIGVRNPVLKSIIKEHKDDVELRLEDFELGKYLEIDFIYFGLGLLRKKDIDSQLDFLRREIFKAKSWVITDCSSTYIKKLTFDKYFKFFLETYNSSFEYERREAYVLGLKLYEEKEILKIFDYLKENETYMVMMAEAWLLATIAINFEEEVYQFLLKTKDDKLKRKTISKMCDSFRIKESTKEKIKALR